MKILITGMTGFIGEHLVLKLQQAGHEIIGLVRPSSDLQFAHTHHFSTHVFTGQVAELGQYLGEEKIEGIIHLASLFLTTHLPTDIEPLLSSNVLFSTQVLEAATQAQVKWFINTGTFWQHYQEYEYSPVNLYAATKQAFQDIAAYYINTFPLNFATLQLSDTFGPGDKRPKVIALWKKISQSGELLPMSSGEQILDLSYIDNVTDAFKDLVMLLAKDEKLAYKGQVFAVSSPEKVTLKELASIFEEVSGKQLQIAWGQRPYRPREVMKPWSKGLPVPGWNPKVSLKEGIKRTMIESL